MPSWRSPRAPPLRSFRKCRPRLEISRQAEFFPLSCFFQSCKVILFCAVVCIAAEQKPQGGIFLLSQTNDRLGSLFWITRLFPVVIALKSGSCANCRDVFGMPFA